MTAWRTFGLAVLAGAGLGVGACLVVALAIALERFPTRAPATTVDAPESMQVSNLRRVDFTERLVVTGTLTNAGFARYDEGVVELEIRDAGELVYTCGELVFVSLEPGASGRFQMRCEDVVSERLPASAELRGRVRHAAFSDSPRPGG